MREYQENWYHAGPGTHLHAVSALSTVELVADHDRPDVILLDVSAVTDSDLLAACLEAGATAIVARRDAFDRLVALLEVVPSRGHEADDGALAALSTREAEVLKALMDGKSADEMAAEQFVSITTVRTHIRSILRKLGVRSQLAAVALAHRARWSVPAERPRIFYVM